MYNTERPFIKRIREGATAADHLEFTLRFSGWFWSAAAAVGEVSDLVREFSEASSTRAVATMSDLGERLKLGVRFIRQNVLVC